MKLHADLLLLIYLSSGCGARHYEFLRWFHNREVGEVRNSPLYWDAAVSSLLASIPTTKWRGSRTGSSVLHGLAFVSSWLYLSFLFVFGEPDVVVPHPPRLDPSVPGMWAAGVRQPGDSSDEGSDTSRLSVLSGPEVDVGLLAAAASADSDDGDVVHDGDARGGLGSPARPSLAVNSGGSPARADQDQVVGVGVPLPPGPPLPGPVPIRYFLHPVQLPGISSLASPINASLLGLFGFPLTLT